MSEKTDVVVEKEVIVDPVVTPATKETTEKSEEEIKLEAKKAELEDQIRGLEGTASSLKEDIVRTRQERKEVKNEEQQPQIDEEALLAKLEERNKALLEPVLKENENLRKAVLKSTEEALKAKRQALDSITARMSSATAPKTSQGVSLEAKEEVELSPKDKQIAEKFGLKNPRYLRDVEVL